MSIFIYSRHRCMYIVHSLRWFVPSDSQDESILMWPEKWLRQTTIQNGGWRKRRMILWVETMSSSTCIHNTLAFIWWYHSILTVACITLGTLLAAESCLAHISFDISRLSVFAQVRYISVIYSAMSAQDSKLPICMCTHVFVYTWSKRLARRPHRRYTDSQFTSGIRERESVIACSRWLMFFFLYPCGWLLFVRVYMGFYIHSRTHVCMLCAIAEIAWERERTKIRGGFSLFSRRIRIDFIIKRNGWFT